MRQRCGQAPTKARPLYRQSIAGTVGDGASDVRLKRPGEVATTVGIVGKSADPALFDDDGWRLKGSHVVWLVISLPLLGPAQRFSWRALSLTHHDCQQIWDFCAITTSNGGGFTAPEAFGLGPASIPASSKTD